MFLVKVENNITLLTSKNIFEIKTTLYCYSRLHKSHLPNSQSKHRMIMADPDTKLIFVYEDETVKKNQPPFADQIYDDCSDMWIVDETLFPKTYASFNYTWGLRSYRSAFVFQRHEGLPATSTMNPPMTKANVLLWVEYAKFIFDNLRHLGRSGSETEIIRRAIVKKLTTSAG